MMIKNEQYTSKSHNVYSSKSTEIFARADGSDNLNYLTDLTGLRKQNVEHNHILEDDVNCNPNNQRDRRDFNHISNYTQADLVAALSSQHFTPSKKLELATELAERLTENFIAESEV
tara:strand:- start:1492 stop:1842 length:351 start_codon:yes stop_codon:yes gene_type:complete